MAAKKKSAGNARLERNNLTNPEELHCQYCNDLRNAEEFYDSDSKFYRTTGKIPYCKSCIDEFYNCFLDEYKQSGYRNPEKKAVERICMAFDLYYSDAIFDKVMERYSPENASTTIISSYLRYVKLYQYRKKNYNSTIAEKFKDIKDEALSMSIHRKEDIKKTKEYDESVKFFGDGFEPEDYVFLQEQYNDWTSRHECQTKSQEEIFKQICFTQLELLKATRSKQDTKDLNVTFLKQLDAAKLQPKQNHGETIADNQTFGTLIDKYENTRPLPEIDEDLKDVDKIGLYLDVFFRGHLAKMMGLKNGLSNLYTKFMKKYTVEKPEYNDDSDGEALFDAIFGNATLDDEDN